jgi:hypothetical protein
LILPLNTDSKGKSATDGSGASTNIKVANDFLSKIIQEHKNKPRTDIDKLPRNQHLKGGKESSSHRKLSGL